MIFWFSKGDWSLALPQTHNLPLLDNLRDGSTHIVLMCFIPLETQHTSVSPAGTLAVLCGFSQQDLPVYKGNLLIFNLILLPSVSGQ